MKQFIKNHIMMVLFFVSSAIVLVLAVYVSNMMIGTAQMLEQSTKSQMAALSEAASLLVTAEELDQFMTVEDMNKPEYKQLKNKLDDFTQRAGVMFTYYMRLDLNTNQMQFIIDNVQNPEDEPDGLDSPQIPREDGPDEALSGNVLVVDLESYSTGWDGLLTAWAPVYYADGTLSNMVAGVDMQDIYIRQSRANIETMAVVLVVSLILVLLSCYFCLTMYKRKAKQSDIANEAKGSFLSRMSHEMRTPMNAIIGLSNMAMDSDDMIAIKNHLRNISVSSEHLRRLIDDVLDISKIESGRMELEFTPTLLQDELETIDKIIRPQAQQKQQTFTITAEENLPAAVYYDPVRIRQVLINLLSNAVKFTTSGGEIALTVRCAERKENRCNLQWKVKDSGIGIKQEDIDRLFTPFEQLDVSTTRKYGGTGLGLAISKQLVAMMDGEIVVHSEEGKGSEFVFNTWLEVAEEQEAKQLLQTNFERKLDLSGKTVLLVDDAPINQIIATDMLENYGAVVDTASDGKQAVEQYLAAPDKYDMIFMDIQMPVMDGYEATVQIRASNTERAKSIPIIAITANAFQEDIQKAFDASMNGHIRKPLDAEQIERTILNVLHPQAAEG